MGLGQVSSGATQLNDGTSVLSFGANTLATGLNDAATGSAQLTAGLVTAADSGKALPAGASALSAQGTSKLVESGKATASRPRPEVRGDRGRRAACEYRGDGLWFSCQRRRDYGILAGDLGGQR